MTLPRVAKTAAALMGTGLLAAFLTAAAPDGDVRHQGGVIRIDELEVLGRVGHTELEVGKSDLFAPSSA